MPLDLEAWPPACEAPAEPDDAIRARLNAAVLDTLLVGGVTVAVVAAFGVSFSSPATFVPSIVVQFTYFFACEARWGRTVGKRAFHLRVVDLADRGRPSVRQAAIRNALRLIDAVPLFYGSGLVSLMRTGRKRRQRIGDVAAGTTVVLDGSGRSLRTPRWLLPVVTVGVMALSVAALVKIATSHPGNSLLPPSVPAANAGPPAKGRWRATASMVQVTRLGPAQYAAPFGGDWLISGSCDVRSGCRYFLTPRVGDDRGLTAQLHFDPRDGWIARFPLHRFVCERNQGRPVYGQISSLFILLFPDGGHRARGAEHALTLTPACQEETLDIEWSATLATGT